MRTETHNKVRLLLAACALAVLTAMALSQPVKSARASTTITYDGRTFGNKTTPLDDTGHLNDLFGAMPSWLSAMMDMAQQLTTVMMDQIFVVGTLLDAQDQLDTQRLMQEMVAEAHRDYQSDVTMCVLGGNVRSLAPSEQKAVVNTRALDLTMLKRDTLSQGTSAAVGFDIDAESRFLIFEKTYCDIADASQYLVDVCAKNISPSRINKDINYTQTIEGNYTLNVDFTSPTHTTDEDDVIALSRNLFAFKNFTPIPPQVMAQVYAKDQYEDMRSVDAIRSVATNSFSHIVGMRSPGTDTTDIVKPYMDVIMQQLGLPGPPNTDIDTFLGKNPSYYAQMEILTHKIFEDPRFFTNLYTTPANVERIGATLQALRLMQDRDRYEASLRREMLVSMLLELSIRDRQETVVNHALRAVNTMVYQP